MIDSETSALDQGKQRTLTLLVTIPNMLTQFVQENDKLTTMYKKLCNTGMNLKGNSLTKAILKHVHDSPNAFKRGCCSLLGLSWSMSK
jgi:hypothetical protein